MSGGGDPRDAARERVRALAKDAVDARRPTAWFESVYREARGDATRVPWADLAPNAAFAGWTARPGALDGVRRACVVGCGLGDDAVHLAARGVEDVVAFDVSPTAIAWARRRHAEARVRFEVADLLALPAAWCGSFDLVVEVYTLQALPEETRPAAAAGIASLAGPGGRVFVFTRLREEGARVEGPPWPLARSEVARLFGALRAEEPLAEVPDPDDPEVVRAHGVWRKPA